MDISPLLFPVPYIVIFVGAFIAIDCMLLLMLAAPMTAIGLHRRKKKTAVIGAWLMSIAITVGALAFPLLSDFCALFLG
jgi:uncharacterized membrane protein YvlD (DUF360 family)